ncbi:MAG: GNAT family N-acetyltransferase [Anaerolineales bacterium]|nr:GNAT family N-acetyltransferase [Anaerolineales bacterium]
MTIRSFNLEHDLAALINLRQVCEDADQTGFAPSEEQSRAQLTLPGHDPTRDRWVADIPGNPGQLAGYAVSWLPPESDTCQVNVLIHPEWRGQGLGKALLARALERALELGAATAHFYASHRPATLGEFLRQQGFTPQGAYTEMRAPADLRLPSPAWPYGYTLRTYAELQDLALLTQAMNQCYQGLWGHNEASQEEMEEWLADWDPAGLLLVFSPSGKLAGISRVEQSAERSEFNDAPTGYIDAPGLTPHHRRIDLYRALLVTGMRWLQGKGVEVIEMESWGDKAEIIQMYREIGFEIVRQYTEHQRMLEK